MSVGKKILFGGMGWVLGGPIGALIGYFLAAQGDANSKLFSGHAGRAYPQTQPGDFMISMLVLFSAVMKADRQMLKSELDYVKQFLQQQQFGAAQVQDFMTLFKDIVKQDYPLRDVCRQIQRSMDHPSRLELVHVLFGLSRSDGHVHPDEVKIIHTIARYLNVNNQDFDSIKAMFFRDTLSDYTILEVDSSSSDEAVKKAYRKVARKYHPDKVSHLGEDLKHLAEEKFKAVNDAYQNIKKERDLA